MSETYLRATSMWLPDYYATLVLARDASQNETEKTCRRLISCEAGRG